jgi:DNA-binding MarR family transcriptional regulator
VRTVQMTREPRAVRLGRDVHLNVLLLASKSLEDLEAICQAEGITHAQYVALWTLCLHDDADDGLPVGAVADGLLNRAADVTRLVDRLERAGLVERLPNPTDRRSVLVRATDQGRRAFASVTPKLQDLHRRQWSNLSTAEVEMLRTLLAKALWADAPDAGPEPGR